MRGEVRHRRSLCSVHGTSRVDWLREHVDPDAEIVTNGAKYKYLMPLDAEMRQLVAPLAKPYPKRVGSETR